MPEEPTGTGDSGRIDAPTIPDLGFFGGDAGKASPFGSAPSRFGGPPPSQFGSPPPSQFGSPPPSQFGGRPPSQFGGPAPAPFGAPPAAPYGYNAPAQAGPRRGGLPGWAVALIAVVGGVVLLGIVAAVAIPVFVSMRANSAAAATTISTPTQISDFQRVDDASSSAGAEQLAASMQGQFGQEQLKEVKAALYQRGSMSVVVLALRPAHGMTMAEQAQVVRGFIQGMEQSTGFPPTLSPVLSGSLGGTFGCAQVQGTKTNAVACLATSPGAVIMEVVSGHDSYESATSAAVTLRDGVEHRG